ncbi:MAG: hypothetical protein IPN92_10140 [Chromatiaceae bacterium]|nr:hypothetical protein [Chromatiaceae bacterium]
MSTLEFQSEIKRHWKKWLPKKWRALVEAGTVEEETLAVAQMAQQEKLSLMQAGYPETAADEVVRAEYILLKPE